MAGKKKKKQDDKKQKKTERCSAENYLGDTWQRYSMDGVIRSTTGSIGSIWRKTGDSGRRIHSLGTIGTHS